MNETEIGHAIAAGALPSPQKCAGFWLACLRFTGTGSAFRSSLDEHVYRPPENYLTPEFLARCQGLPVIAMHPPGELDSAEYEARTLGSITFAYVAGPDGIESPDGAEVWCICRIYSDNAMAAITEAGMSTSPAVIFHPADGNKRVELENGSVMLLEGTPSILDHLCICEQGVWDRAGPPSGIRLDSETRKVVTMADEETKAAAEKARKDEEEAGKGSGTEAFMDKLEGLIKRLDEIEARAVKEHDEKEAEERADKARRDAAAGLPSAKTLDEQRKDEHACLDAQARADSAYQSWGLRAPPPMSSEQPLAYRRRLLRGLQRHSSQFKDSSLDTLSADKNTFDAVEGIIFADAVQASKNPVNEDGRQIKRVRHDPESGHRITEFFGGDSIFKAYAQPSQRVTRFNTPQNMGAHAR